MALLFGLFGHPVGHSLSKVMHEASFAALGLEAEYRLFDVPPERLAGELRRCREEGFLGLNLTIPHKRAVIPLLDRVHPLAAEVGAVNTVRFGADGSATGFNTDIPGFLADLQFRGRVSPEGRRVMVLGCGGVGRALAFACARAGAKELLLANRTAAKAAELAAELGASSVPSEPGAWDAAAAGCDLVVQCTPCGLKPGDVSPLTARAFHPGQVLYDVVYTPPVTPTMRIAEAAGAVTVNGLGMLVRQGAEAFRLWTGHESDLPAMFLAVSPVSAESPGRR